MEAMVAAQDDTQEVSAEGDIAVVRQYGWRVMRGSGAVHPAIFEAWNGLWQGCLSVHNRFLVLEVLKRMDYGDDCFEWHIRPRRTASF